MLDAVKPSQERVELVGREEGGHNILVEVMHQLAAVAQASLGNLDVVQLPEQVGEPCGELGGTRRVPAQYLRHRLAVEQLEDQTQAVAHLDDVVGDGGGDAQDEGLAGLLALGLDVVPGAAAVVDLDDGLVVETKDLAVAALADRLQALDGELPAAAPHVHHLGEAGHIEDLEDLCRGVVDGDVEASLDQTHHHAQPRARDVFERARVEQNRVASAPIEYPHERFLDLARVGGVDACRQHDGDLIAVHEVVHAHILHPMRPASPHVQRRILTEH